MPAYLSQRNEAVRFIREQGREKWEKQSGYHLRSRNETVMFRYKTTFGPKLEARKEANQSTEAIVKCKILNRFRQTGCRKYTRWHKSSEQTLQQVLNRLVAVEALEHKNEAFFDRLSLIFEFVVELRTKK